VIRLEAKKEAIVCKSSKSSHNNLLWDGKVKTL